MIVCLLVDERMRIYRASMPMRPRAPTTPALTRPVGRAAPPVDLEEEAATVLEAEGLGDWTLVTMVVLPWEEWLALAVTTAEAEAAPVGLEEAAGVVTAEAAAG